MTVTRRSALGLGAAARRPRPVHGLRAEPGIGRIRLSWKGEAYAPLVDHYAIYGSRSAGFGVGPDTLVGKTVYGYFAHDRMGGARQEWHYRIVTVDAAGNRSRPSAELSASSVESVTVAGSALATVGDFDHKTLELALAPKGYAQYRARFGDGPDYTYGKSTPGNDWAYIQPGPADSWAGNRPSRATFRFPLESVPSGETWLAVWLVDTHASLPGTVKLALNGTPVREVPLEFGGTRGSMEGDATLPNTPLKPSYVELPLPAAALKAGENVLTIDKQVGSWHVYDALGIFAR
ncbi:polysaccharide lyase family protein [Spirillospora sp. NPDC029432]|uniref:polysaccharide lyase family protein n=1 Tax=Spirillospora sp. NPDC029432 TaxID=3154599 RepID=UPI003451449E